MLLYETKIWLWEISKLQNFETSLYYSKLRAREFSKASLHTSWLILEKFENGQAVPQISVGLSLKGGRQYGFLYYWNKK